MENIHVINKTQKLFTITDKNGKFLIVAKLNDTISFSSVQHKPKELIISKEILDRKVVSVFLEEKINALDQVTIGKVLTGNLHTDITRIKKNKIPSLNIDTTDKNYIYEDIKLSEKEKVNRHFQSTLNPDTRYYQPNIKRIIERLLKTKLDLSIKIANPKKNSNNSPLLLKDVYTKKHLSETFLIDFDNINAFIAFVENQGYDNTLLKPENEMKLIEFLFEQYKLFLNIKNDKK